MGNTHNSQKSRLEADALQQTSDTDPAEDVNWGYNRDRGPDTWWMHYSSASGSLQSPINISPEEAEEFRSDEPVPPLKVEYPVNEGKKMVWNTGYTLQLEVRSGNRAFYVTGGPLKSNQYELREVHLHWGERDETGSEHMIQSVSYAMEIHFVHWNSALYSSYDEACCEEGGLVIMAVLVNLDNRCNSGIEQLCSYTERIQYKRQWENLSMDIKDLLPRDLKKYWLYKGSMTTPPCHESVTWIIFQDTISVTSYELDLLRTLKSHCPNDRPTDGEHEGYILKNCRNVQVTGTRRLTHVEHMYTIGQIDPYLNEYQTY